MIDVLGDYYEDTATGASAGVRELVAAVVKQHGHSMAEYARRLRVSTKTVSERVATAVEHGWLVNDEARPGHPARLAPGDPLPTECGLPSVEQLKAWTPRTAYRPADAAEAAR